MKRRVLIKTPAFKRKRLESKKRRNGLRYRQENKEGVTYESNCSLLTAPAVEHVDVEDPSIDQETVIDGMQLILFDLETSSLAGDCDILQIAAKCGNSSFDNYVIPIHKISASATEVNGLTSNFGELLLHGMKVTAVPLRIALRNLLQWMKSFGQPCYIATHNLNFDGPRLYKAISASSLNDDFRQVIHGFIDTLKVIKNHTNRKEKGECTIGGLANWLNISSAGSHNAIADVEILQKVLIKAKIGQNVLLDAATCFDEQTERWEKNSASEKVLQTLNPMKNVVGESIRKKIADASITIDKIQEVFKASGSVGVTDLFGKKINGKQLVSIRKSSLEKILQWAEENCHQEK